MRGAARRRRRNSGDAATSALPLSTQATSISEFISESEGLGALASSEAPCSCVEEASDSIGESEGEKTWSRGETLSSGMCPESAQAGTPASASKSFSADDNDEPAKPDRRLNSRSGGREDRGKTEGRAIEGAERDSSERSFQTSDEKTASGEGRQQCKSLNGGGQYPRCRGGGARGGGSVSSNLSLGAEGFSEKWEKKVATFRVRCRWTLILICLFFLILSAGHFFCMVLVLAIIAAIYREIIQAKETFEEHRLHDFYLLKWYWFLTTIVGIGLPWAVPRFWGLAPTTVHALESYHSLGIYVMFLVGFIWFVLSLRKGHLRYQFSQFGLVMGVLIVVVSQSLIQVANIYSGLIWFFLPTSLVIVNDIAAYIFGTAFGRTRLIKLSPKKTVEGYVGAAVVTLLWAWVVGRQLEMHQLFVCPQPYISFKPFAMFSELQCTPSPVYIPTCADVAFDRIGSFWLEDSNLPDTRKQALHDRQQQLLLQHSQLLDAKAEAEEQLRALHNVRNGGTWLSSSSTQSSPSTFKSSPSTALPDEREAPTSVVERRRLDAAEESDFFARVAALEKQKGQITEALSLVERARTAAEVELRSQCRSLWAAPFDLHAMVLGSFAAFFAPFGGFFASGFKRAVRIKDFGYFIPGHGGVTDRFDCQVIMGLFTFLYQKTFVPQIREAEEAARRRALLLPASAASSSAIQSSLDSSASPQEQRRVMLLQRFHRQGETLHFGGSSAGSMLGKRVWPGGFREARMMQSAVVDAMLKTAESLDDGQLLLLRSKLKQLAASRQRPEAHQEDPVSPLQNSFSAFGPPESPSSGGEDGRKGLKDGSTGREDGSNEGDYGKETQSVSSTSRLSSSEEQAVA